MRTSPPRLDHRIGSIIAGGTFGLTVLLLLHRYPGIVHDSILYMGEGLARQSPDIFGRDLFFMHGGQGQYSLMPWLLGLLYRFAPPPQVFLWGTFVSLLLFAAASWFLLKTLLPARQRVWAWLGTACLPPIYGVASIFGYGETFLTSRPIAEALCLLAIGCLAHARWRLAGICITIAALFHPLQAIAALLVVWPWMVIQDRRWLHALWLSIPMVLLAFAGVYPFSGLLEEFDPEWLAAARTSRQLFVTQWALGDYKVLAFDIFLLVVGCKLLPARWRQWCVAALAGLALGFGASLLLVDALHLVLPTGLQLWRVHWLAHWFAIVTLAALLYRHLHEGDAGRALLLMLAAQLAWGETSFGALSIALLYAAWPWLVAPPRERLRGVLTGLFALGLVLLFANHARNEWTWFIASGADLSRYPLDIRLLMFPALALALPLLALACWQRAARPTARLVLAICLLPLLLVAAWRWDARKPLMLAFEREASKPDVFGIALPAQAQVLWHPESLVGTWLVLGRASYYSESQLAGQVFNAATFRDGQARWRLVQPMIGQLKTCMDRDRKTGKMDACPISPTAWREACATSTTQAPVYIVLPYRQQLSEVGQWQPMEPGGKPASPRLWLYGCENPSAPDKAVMSVR